MNSIHSRAGRSAVAVAALVVAVGVVHPGVGAVEPDAGIVDEQEADTDGEVEAEQIESAYGEAEADADNTSIEESALEPELAEAEPDAGSEDAADSDAQSAPEPDGESPPDSGSGPEPEPDSALEPEPDSALEPETNPEPQPDPEPQPQPEPEPERTPKAESDAGDAGPDAQSEVDDASERVAGAVPERSDSESDSGSDSDPEPKSSSDAPSDASAAAASSPSPPSGSAAASHSHTDESASRAQPMAPRSSSDQSADDEGADNDPESAVVPGEGMWPKRTLEAAAGKAIRPIATEGLSSSDLAALKSTNTAYPAAGASGVRAPMVAGPGDRTAEPAPAPQTAAADGAMGERVAEVLGGAVSGGASAGVPAAAVALWQVLTALALLLVVVGGHLRWAAMTGARDCDKPSTPGQHVSDTPRAGATAWEGESRSARPAPSVGRTPTRSHSVGRHVCGVTGEGRAPEGGRRQSPSPPQARQRRTRQSWGRQT